MVINKHLEWCQWKRNCFDAIFVFCVWCKNKRRERLHAGWRVFNKHFFASNDYCLWIPLDSFLIMIQKYFLHSCMKSEFLLYAKIIAVLWIWHYFLWKMSSLSVVFEMFSFPYFDREYLSFEDTQIQCHYICLASIQSANFKLFP